LSAAFDFDSILALVANLSGSETAKTKNHLKSNFDQVWRGSALSEVEWGPRPRSFSATSFQPCRKSFKFDGRRG